MIDIGYFLAASGGGIFTGITAIFGLLATRKKAAVDREGNFLKAMTAFQESVSNELWLCKEDHRRCEERADRNEKRADDLEDRFDELERAVREGNVPL